MNFLDQSQGEVNLKQRQKKKKKGSKACTVAKWPIQVELIPVFKQDTPRSITTPRWMECFTLPGYSKHFTRLFLQFSNSHLKGKKTATTKYIALSFPLFGSLAASSYLGL